MDTEEKDELQPEKEQVAIYSRWAILGFSVFFSPLVGSVLLMLNFRRIGHKTAGYLALLFGIAYVTVAQIVLIKLGGPDLVQITPEKLMANQKLLYYSKAFDVLGAAILAEYVFRKYFRAGNYSSRSIVMPLLITITLALLVGASV